MKPILNLFIIGASKCGTTTVWDYLDHLPEVSMGREKEPYIFSFSNWRCRLDLFVGDYDPEKKWRGEASTIYSETHVTPETPKRIYEYNPEARIIYIVRNPFDRLLSVWQQTLATGHHLRRAYEDKTDATKVEKMPRCFGKAIWEYPIMLQSCEYQRHVDAYASVFPREHILLLYYEDLKNRPAFFYQQLREFLDLSPENALNNRPWLNRRSEKEMLTPPLLSSLSSALGLKRFFAKNKFLKNALKRLATVGIQQNPVYTDQLKESICLHLRNDPVVQKTLAAETNENRD